MDKIIAKYLDQSLSLKEQHKLAKWLEETPENIEYLKKIQVYWKNYSQDFTHKQQQVKERIEQAIYQEERTRLPKNGHATNLSMKIAASFILLIAASWLLITLNLPSEKAEDQKITYNLKSTLPGQILTTKLPDGTIVKLNGDSKIWIPSSFSTTTREVTLQGEAFFEVTKDKAKPFIVNTPNFDVKVLGTSFNVKTFQKEQFVAVKTGKVNVSSIKNQKDLYPDQMVWLDQNHDMIVTTVDEETIYAWTKRELIFKEETISEVLEATENWFGVEIMATDEVKKQTKLYSSKFHNPSLIQVMESVSKVYHLNYKIKSKNQIAIQKI